MAQNASIVTSALLITDSFKNAVHGTSTFANFFIEDVLSKTYTKISVLEVETGKVYTICGQNASTNEFSVIYINANFSQADLLVRKHGFEKWCLKLGIIPGRRFKKILISHGWTKTRFRWNYYSIYYNLKNIFRARNLHRLLFYDEIIFISTATDQFRHKDYFYALKNGLPIRRYNFSESFTNKIRLQKQNISNESKPDKYGYILVISNFEKVKNLWWLILYNLRRRLFAKQEKKFVVLIKPTVSLIFKVFTFCSKIFNVELVYAQHQKYSLLINADYLFIPSFTEYNPLVALEAIACDKNIISLYKITALTNRKYYKYLKD